MVRFLPVSADDFRQHVAARGAEDVRGLVLGDGQVAGGERVHRDVGAQRGAQRVGVRRAFDVDVQRRHDRVAVRDDRVARAAEQLSDRLRVDVDGLHAQHVVAAAADADAWCAPAARARRGPDRREVARLNQTTNRAGNEHMARLTKRLIDLCSDLGGRFFLPYQLHYTPEQLERAYPEIRSFFTAKKEVDPEGVFHQHVL